MTHVVARERPCADHKKGPVDFDWREGQKVALLDLLTQAARDSMSALRGGSYNSTVVERLPYFHRTGVVARDAVLAADPQVRDAIFDGMDDATYDASSARGFPSS